MASSAAVCCPYCHGVFEVGRALTGREVELLELVAAGEENKEIGRELGITVNTVKNHLTTVYGKLHARGRANAVRIALQRGIIGGAR